MDNESIINLLDETGKNLSDEVSDLDVNADGEITEEEAKQSKGKVFWTAFLSREKEINPKILDACIDARTQQVLILAFNSGKLLQKLVFYTSMSPVFALLVERALSLF